jgi:hypothetical protein
VRLFPSRKVPAFVELVAVDQFGERPLRPTARAQIDLVRKGALVNGSIIFICSMIEPGHPCVTMSGNALSCFEST